MNPKDLQQLAIDTSLDVPLFAQVRDGLRDLICNQFKPGDQFYSDKVLVEHLPVSQITIRRALGELAKEGFISRKVGVGSVVSNSALAEQSLSRQVSSRFDRRSGSRLVRPAPQMLNHPMRHEITGPTAHGARTIGVFVNQCESDYNYKFIDHISEIGWQSETPIRYYYDRDGKKLSKHLANIEDRQEDEGFLLFMDPYNNGLVYHALSHLGYRSVIISGVAAGRDIPTIDTDPIAAVNMGLDHLVQLGHKRITLLVNEPIVRSEVTAKVEAFNSGTRQHEIDTECHTVVCDLENNNLNSHNAAYAAMPEAWSRRPTAIFAVSDSGAWAAMKWLSERNIVIPKEVSVLGFEDAPLSRYMSPSLTTLAQPVDEIIRTAFEALRDSGPLTGFHVLLKPTLVVRESTGPVPGSILAHDAELLVAEIP